MDDSTDASDRYKCEDCGVRTDTIYESDKRRCYECFMWAIVRRSTDLVITPRPRPMKKHQEPSIDQGFIPTPPLRYGKSVGTLGRMRDFFARQYSTKTGKASMTTIVGTGAALLAGTITASAALPTIVFAALAMLLRDGEAKRKQENGE